MDAALQSGLGHDQGFRFGQELADFLGQQKRFGTAIEDIAVIVAQQAEIGSFHRIRFLWQHIAVWAGLEGVAASAEEHEPFMTEPFEKLDGFFLVARRHMGVAVQPLNLCGHTGAHLLIVRRRSMHVRQSRFGLGEQ